MIRITTSSSTSVNPRSPSRGVPSMGDPPGLGGNRKAGPGGPASVSLLCASRLPGAVGRATALVLSRARPRVRGVRVVGELVGVLALRRDLDLVAAGAGAGRQRHAARELLD